MIGHLPAQADADFEARLLELCDSVDARHDCADFRLITLVKVLYAWPQLLSESTRRRCEQTVLAFKYWLDEPGIDDMCYWSENHQVLFATCEYLAGQLFPDHIFPNLGVNGRRRRERGRARLLAWLDDRFRHGFIEWLSNTYYEEDVAALSVLIDHAEDSDLVARATVVLDLLMLDMALHRFGGRFVASAGRAYEHQKIDPAYADVNDILDNAFGTGIRPDLSRVSAVFVLRDRYRVPETIRRIAAAPEAFTVTAHHGLDLLEAASGDPETAVVRLWAMESFTDPGSIRVTASAMRRWELRHNMFLRPLARFVSWPARLLPAAVRLLNPVTQGVTIHRANVQTCRDPHWLLSSAQRYHPREFGDQQHLWQASLPGDINVFATHPGAWQMAESGLRGAPGRWVGNGRNPDVAQHHNLLLAVHDLGGRRGYLEAPRARYTHLWFPVERFDEVRTGRTWVCGRVADSLIGVRSARPLRRAGHEFVQSGRLTAYAVVCSDTSRSGDLDAFTAHLCGGELSVGRQRTSWRLPPGETAAELVLHRNGNFVVDGNVRPSEYPRLDSPFGRIERSPHRIELACRDSRLILEAAGEVCR